jgi:hypothetical protein
VIEFMESATVSVRQSVNGQGKGSENASATLRNFEVFLGSETAVPSLNKTLNMGICISKVETLPSSVKHGNTRTLHITHDSTSRVCGDLIPRFHRVERRAHYCTVQSSMKVSKVGVDLATPLPFRPHLSLVVVLQIRAGSTPSPQSSRPLSPSPGP